MEMNEIFVSNTAGIKIKFVIYDITSIVGLLLRHELQFC